MSACAFQEDLDEAFAPKAAWRRQNSAKLHGSAARTKFAAAKCAAVVSSRGQTLRKTQRNTKEKMQRRTRENNNEALLASSCFSEMEATYSRAEWHVQLPAFFRTRLTELCEFSPHIEAGDDARAVQSPLASRETEAEFVWGYLAGMASSCDLLRDYDESSETPPASDAEDGSSGRQPLRETEKPETANAMVQCSPEEIVQSGGEPMACSPLGQRTCLHKLRTAKLHNGTSYSVALHFSLFEDPSTMARHANELSPEELAALANRFLGAEITGVLVTRSKARNGDRPVRRVTERHVAEAALIGDSRQVFRESLLVGARRLLVGGFAESPFHGQGMLELAHECPGEWAKLAVTALDFTGRLIKAGALPRAFAAELLKGLAELPPKMLALGMLMVLPAVRSSVHGARRAQMYQRARGGLARTLSSSSSPACSRSMDSSGLRRLRSGMTRTFTAPPRLNCSRTVGTCLHLQDDFQPYTCISVNFASKKGAPAEAGPSIPDSFLPDYWRYSAGGEHLPDDLEKRARKADAELDLLAQEAESPS